MNRQTRTTPRLLGLVMILLLATACAPTTNTSNGAGRVTSIPAEELTSVAQAASVTPTLTPTISATEELSTVTTSITEEATDDQSASNATPTPLDNNLAAGNAMDIAAATDTMIQVTPREPLTFDQSPVQIAFDEFYDGYSIRHGLQLSDKLTSLDGLDVTMEGYMAPPLKPELDYFVLTRVRLAFCPFCSTAGDWPDDIALVYLLEETMTATEYPIRITGRMEVGMSVDAETGMVSLVRIYANDVEVLS
jgi:hypothetical protein